MPEDVRQTDSTNDNDIESGYNAEADRLKLFFEITKYGIYDWNPQTNEIYTNSIFLSMLGYKDDEIYISTKFFNNNIHPDDLNLVKTIFNEYYQGRESHEIEFRFRAKSGEYLWILSSGRLAKRDIDGKPLRIIGLLSDVTEKKNISAKYIESEEKFYKVFQMSPEPSSLTTIDEGRYLEVNDAFLSTYGYLKEEVINKTSKELGTWDSSVSREFFIKSIKKNTYCNEIELASRKKDGSMLNGLLSASIIHLSTGPVLFTMYRDITERKRTLEFLRVQKDLGIALSRAVSLKEVGECVFNAIFWINEIDSGGLYIRDIETGNLSLIAHHGLSDSFIKYVSHYKSDNLQAKLVAKGDSAYRSYPETDVPKNNVGFKEGLKFLITLPIKHEEKVIAALNLASHRYDQLLPEIRERLESIAFMLGSAIARVQTTMAIREINARLHAVIESPRDISIFSLNTDYCYTSFNKVHESQMLALLNVNIKTGMNFFNFFSHEKGFEPVKLGFERAFKGEHLIKVYERSGSFFQFTFNPIFDDNHTVTGVSCFIQDITERKLYENTLRESETKFATIIETAAEGILIAEYGLRNFIYANSEICSMLGYNTGELLGKNISGIHPEKNISEVLDKFAALRSGKLKVAHSVPFLRKNGTIFYADVRASVITIKGVQYSVGFITDVTERKQAHDFLRIQKDMSTALAGATEIEEVGTIVLDAVTQLEGIDSGGLYLRDIETGRLKLIICRGVSDLFVKTNSCFEPDTFHAQVVTKSEPLFISQSEPDFYKDNARVEEGLKLLLIIPIKYKNKVVADFTLSSHTHDELPSGVRDFIEAIAGKLGDSIARVLTETAVREANARIKAIIESPRNISIYSLDANYRYIFFNERHRKEMLSIYNRDIKNGMIFFDALTKPEYCIKAKEDFDSALRGESIRKILKRFDNIYEYSLSPIFIQNRKIIGVSCFVQNITERILTEEALQESLMLFDAQFKSSPDLIMIIDQDYKIVNINRILTGSFTIESIRGADAIDVLPPEHRSGIRQRLERCFASGELLEFEHCIGNGRWVSARVVRLIQTGKPPQLMIISTDITEKRNTLNVLHIQKNMSIALAGASELTTVGSIVVDAVMQMEGIDCAGLYLRDSDSGGINLIAHRGLSKNFLKIASSFGPETPQAHMLAKGETIYLSYRDLDIPRVKAGDREGFKLLFFIPIKHENNVIASLNLASHVVNELPSGVRDGLEAIAGILGNSIGRVRNDIKIREINARIHSIIESPRDIVIYSIDTDYCLTSFNNAFKKVMMDLADAEIENGTNILDLMGDPSLRKEAKENYDRTLNGESSTKNIKIRNTYYDFTISPILKHNGKVIGVSCFARDITDQKIMEERLRQSEKMEAIGQLAGGIAHDFNNELSIISGYSELLRDEVKDNSNMLTYIDSILKGIRRSANLISQMLAFSRKGKFLLTSVDIHEIITDIVLMLEHSIDKRIVILQDLRARPSITLGDPSQLKSAILNLALNARDAMPDGGDLLFATDIVDISDEIYKNAPYYISLGKYIVVSVSDTGIGMDKKTQNRLFEPFFTTKGKGKGTGFGLASVYGTVKNHSGMINVYSEKGRGSVFKVYLPVTKETPDTETDTETDTSAPSAKNIKVSAHVLLVDDEEDLRIVGEKMLKKLGHTVSVCKDGKEAVKFYKKSWNKIDIVLLDMIMPAMNGKDAFIAMKKINPHIKALLTSGYSLNGEAQSILDKGVKGFLQKPFKKNELLMKISEILNS